MSVASIVRDLKEVSKTSPSAVCITNKYHSVNSPTRIATACNRTTPRPQKEVIIHPKVNRPRSTHTQVAACATLVLLALGVPLNSGTPASALT